MKDMANEVPENQETYRAWLDAERKKLLLEESKNDEVRESPISGKGLFAKRDFQRDERIARYLAGRYDPLYTSTEVDEQHLGERVIQTGINAKGEALYVTVPSDHPRTFVNHSCTPSAGLRITRNPDGSRISDLIAIHPIGKDEEITIDYSTTQLEPWEMACRCGSPSCRGVVTEFTRLPRELQRKYIEMGIVQDFIIGATRKDEG